MIELLVSLLVVLATILAAYALTIIDNIVHSQLYNYGLQFSYSWANPYWFILKVIFLLLGIIAISTSAGMIYVYRRERKKLVVEKKEPVVQEAIKEAIPSLPALFQCGFCKKSFTHPLRMLDFQNGRPKMVNICPFCNRVVAPAVQGRDEVKAEKKTQKKEQAQSVDAHT